MLSVVVSLLISIGLRAAMVLPIRQYPNLSNTVVTVTTSYPGASPELINGFITADRAGGRLGRGCRPHHLVLGARHLDDQVFVKLNFDPNQALTEVLAKVNSVKYLIPKEINDPVVTKATATRRGDVSRLLQ